MKKWNVFTGILVAAMIASGTAQAQTPVTWTNSNGGNFGDGFNWDSGAAPLGGSTTVFTDDTAYTVSFISASPSIVNVSEFNGQGGVVTLDITGRTWNLTNSGDAFGVGFSANTTASVVIAGGVLAVTNGTASAGTAQVNVGVAGVGSFLLTNGTVYANRTVIGNGAGGSSVLTISGSSSVYSNFADTGTFAVGSGSSFNQLIITNGGTLFNGVEVSADIGHGAVSVSNNVAIVTGSGSTWNLGAQTLRVGNAIGAGASEHNNSLLVNSGGLVTNASGMIVADASSSGVGGYSNQVVVSSGGQLFVAGQIRVGLGTFTSNNVFQVGGTGAAALVSATGSLEIGGNASSGFNSLIVTNATLLTTNGTSQIGSISSGNNSGTITAGGTWNLEGQTLDVGEGGYGTGNVLTVTSGGVVTNVLRVFIGDNTGTAFHNQLIVQNGGTLVTSTGSITVSSDSAGSSNLFQAGGSGASSFVNVHGVVVGTGASTFGNGLVVTNATLLTSATSSIGAGSGASSNNYAGIYAGGTWNAQGSSVIVGNSSGAGGNANTLTIYSGGVLTNATVTVGVSGANNALVLNGGQAYVSNLTVNASQVLTFNGGTLNTGGTTVNNGLLTVGNGTSAANLQLATGGTGFHSFNAGLTIANNATLSGVGTVIGATTVNNGGVLSPGDAPGSITFSNNLTLAAGSTFALTLNGTGAGQYDQIVGAGNVSVSNSVLSLILGYTPAAGDTFTIISNQGPNTVFGVFTDPSSDNLINGATFVEDGVTFQISYTNMDTVANAPQDVTLTVVPEPSTMMLVGSGLALMTMLWRRRGRRSA